MEEPITYIPYNNIQRSPFETKRNNLPKSPLGVWLTDSFTLGMRIKPAIDDHTIMIEVLPKFQVFDAATKTERYSFETGTTFRFSGLHSQAEIIRLSYYVICLAVDEFNEALSATQSMLSLERILEKPTVTEIEPQIKEALKLDNYKNDNIPWYWKVASTGSTEENETIISSLPPIPVCKQFYHTEDIFRADNPPTTPEGAAIGNILQGKGTAQEDIDTVKQAVDFYQKTLPQLLKIDLTKLSEEQEKTVNAYLTFVFSTQVPLINHLNNHLLYRVTVINRDFLDQGKVREAKFLSFPPLDVLKERNKYNRASSPERSLLYVAQSINTALRETKAEKGARIIISTWFNHSAKPLMAYPLHFAAGINNPEVDQATHAFEQFHARLPPVVGLWMELIMSFISTAFVKDSDHIHPKRCDYLFSAKFGDMILQQGDHVKLGTGAYFDCIMYPSVAGKHATNNLAVLPETVKSRMMMCAATEYEVMDTWYDADFQNDAPPAELKILRKLNRLNNGRISWDDDK